MTEIKTVTRSLRATRLQATLPRALGLLVVVVLCAAGLHSILTRPTTTVISRASGTTVDQGAESFAQSFARAYLTWNGQDETERQNTLAQYLSSSLDQDGGLNTGGGAESVSWTSIAGAQSGNGQTLVTVAAQTSGGMVYLSVPVARDDHGFLYVSGYPAFVGPPATDPSASVPVQDQTGDSALQAVVARAVTNYLSGNNANLLADLTPTALVSLPTQHLTVSNVQQATWIVPEHRVALQVTATDTHGDSFTLAYEVGVEKLDRWFVQSIQVNPTFRGGTS